jgi:CHASE2 domain-containing sensor protein
MLDKLLATLLRSGLLAVLLLLVLILLVSWLLLRNAWKHTFFLNKKLR